MQNLKTCFQKLCWGVAWLREAMSVQTECRAMRACSQELCWGAAWLREAKIQHRHPEIQIFELPNIAPRYCWTEKISLKILYLEAFQSVFQVRTKMKSGYTILSHANYQNVRITHFLPRPTAISHTSLCYRIAFVPAFCVWVMKYKQHKRMFHFEVAHSLVLLGVKLVC